MNKINVKILNDDALIYIKKNIDRFAKLIREEEDNKWLEVELSKYKPLFVEKKYKFNDFELTVNNDEKDKDIVEQNSIALYENLKSLPNYILTMEAFWLWLALDKFYKETRSFMNPSGKSVFKDHWLFTQGQRRGLFFGVLPRMFFRVKLTVDESLDDKYYYTKWVCQNTERIRNHTWRTYSSESHIVKGILKAEMHFVESYKEKNKYYSDISKYVSLQGSVKLLDCFSEDDIEKLVYDKLVELDALENSEKAN